MLGKAQIVIVILTLLLMIASVSILIWSFIQLKKDDPWPPNSQSCPDYWKVGSTGNCIGAAVNMGTCTYSGSYASVAFGTDTCQMYQWTQGTTSINGITGCTGILWDGISYGYGVNNPCYVSE